MQSVLFHSVKSDFFPIHSYVVPEKGKERWKEIPKKAFATFEEFWKIFAGKALAGSRRVAKIVRLQLSPKSAAYKTIDLISKRTKLTGFIGVPLAMRDWVKKMQNLHTIVRQRDVDASVCDSFEGAATSLDLVDKWINLVDGVSSFFSLSPAAHAALGIAGTVSGALQTTAQSIFFATGAYKIDRHRKLKDDIELLRHHVDNEKFLVTFLQNKIGVTEGEQRSLVDKVETIAKKRGWNTEQIEQETAVRKERILARKHRIIERSTTKKAAKVMAQMRESLDKGDALFPAEKRREIFQEMRTMVHRNLAFQSFEMVRSLAGAIGGLLLLASPLNPVLGLSIVATAIFAAIATSLVKKYLMQRNLQHIHD